MSTDILKVQGLNGEKTLEGEIVVSGAKNAILPAFASSILFSGKVQFEEISDLEDVKRVIELIELLGAKIENGEAGKYSIDPSLINKIDLNKDIAKRLRASVIFIGPMLARFGEVKFPHPGGCVIGERPIDIFLEVLKAMGATLREDDEYYILEAKNGLKGVPIFLKVPSVTVTEMLMLAAVLAKGTTQIKNAAMEPEIIDVANFLISNGAKIKGVGTPTIEIEGGELLVFKGVPYKPIPDRIEAGSFLLLGALTAKNLKIKNIIPEHILSLTTLLKQSGVPFQILEDSILIENNTKKNSEFTSFNIKTHEYPGFPTDLQAPASIFLTQACGESTVFETIFESRLGYANDLISMGANIRITGAHQMIIKGGTALNGRDLYGPDLRAGLAFVIAGLVAEGESRIHNVYYIDRGYENLQGKLEKIGANIKRV